MKKQLLLLVTMLLPMVASAYDIAVKNADGVTIYYNYVNNATELEVTNDGYKSYSGSVDIPEEVTYMNRTRKVTSIEAEAFSFCNELTSITIPYGVTSIGKKAFYYCQTLAYVTIPNSVVTIGEECFYRCISLPSVIIPNSVTSMETGVFKSCHSLTSVTIGSGLEKIEMETFSDCNKLPSITIPNSVTSIGSSAFSDCSSLTSITIPNSVTSIGYNAFHGCSALPYITIPSGVDKIDDYVFQNCSSLISIKIPNSVTSIGNWAFQNCSSLIYVTIPRDLTYMGYLAFDGCDILTIISKIENPSSIGTNTFSVNTFYNATLYVPKGTGYKYKNTTGWKEFHFIDDNGGGDNELINYPVLIDGIDLYTSDNSQVSFSTIFINDNSTEVNCIKFGKSYKYTDSEYYYARLSVAGGFKAGDVIEIAGVYNNKDTKNSAISFRIDPTSSPIWTTDNFINGRYSSEEPRIQTYTLTTDADVLYFGRSGNTGTGITYLKVKRDQEVLPTDIAINETNFPDANFRNYLLSQSYGSDGVIAESEIAEIKAINVGNHNIASLKGIEYFTALTTLLCYKNQLTELDVTNNTKLSRFECFENQLTSLDVSKNIALTSLSCGSNQLTTLYVSNNTALTSLSCGYNQLTSLDVSMVNGLMKLYCEHNQLSSLDVSNNKSLYDFDCSYNLLSKLDVSNNNGLMTLNCEANQLKDLDVSINTKLDHLYCSQNQLTTLDVSNHKDLWQLYCSQNQLTTLIISRDVPLMIFECYQNQIKGTAMDALVENLTNSHGPIYVIYNEAEGNEMTVEQVTKVKEKGWIPYYFDGSKWLEYLGSDPNEIVVNEVSYEVTGNEVVVKNGRNCSGDVIIPATITANGQTYPVTGIGDGAFKGNTTITSVTISEGITRIGAEAFEGCTNLKEIIIGRDVTAIADKAFADIVPSASAPRRADGVVLTVSCYAVNVPQTAENAFENTPIDNALLLVNDDIINDYCNAEPWKSFGTIQGFNGGSGINAILADDGNAKIYTLDGKQLEKPQKGLNIIRMSDGSVKKIEVSQQ